MDCASSSFWLCMERHAPQTLQQPRHIAPNKLAQQPCATAQAYHARQHCQNCTCTRGNHTSQLHSQSHDFLDCFFEVYVPWLLLQTVEMALEVDGRRRPDKAPVNIKFANEKSDQYKFWVRDLPKLADGSDINMSGEPCVCVLQSGCDLNLSCCSSAHRTMATHACMRHSLVASVDDHAQGLPTTSTQPCNNQAVFCVVEVNCWPLLAHVHNLTAACNPCNVAHVCFERLGDIDGVLCSLPR